MGAKLHGYLQAQPMIAWKQTDMDNVVVAGFEPDTNSSPALCPNYSAMLPDASSYVFFFLKDYSEMYSIGKIHKRFLRVPKHIFEVTCIYTYVNSNTG